MSIANFIILLGERKTSITICKKYDRHLFDTLMIRIQTNDNWCIILNLLAETHFKKDVHMKKYHRHKHIVSVSTQVLADAGKKKAINGLLVCRILLQLTDYTGLS